MSNTRNWPNIAQHGMTIGGKHTWTDWSLLPKDGIPTFVAPQPRTRYVEVPLASGSIDQSQVITGEISYDDRKGSFEFLLLEDEPFEAAKSGITSHLAGRRVNCVLDDDPSYFYTGRFWVNEAKSNKGYGLIVIDYIVDPYKYSNQRTGSMDWLWNDLFGVTIYYGTFAVNGLKQRTLINPSGQSITPTITCSSPMTVTIDGLTYNLIAGEDTNPGFSLAPGDTEATFTGTGTVLIDYSMDKSL